MITLKWTDFPERTPQIARTEPKEEVRTGLELVRLAHGLTDVELHAALRFAIDLLSEREVDELARLLVTGDEYTAREAAARLGPMKSPRAVDALRQYRRETARFVADGVAALRAAGLDVTDVRLDTACLKLGPVWLNLPTWYHRRQERACMAPWSAARRSCWP